MLKDYFIKKEYWTVLLGALIVLYYSFSITGFGLEFFPGDLVDGRFNNFLLEHDYNFFSGKVESYWNAGFMYPESDVISYSDNLLGTAPFYSIFRIVGADRETAYQLWFVLMTLLNFFSAFLFLKAIFKKNQSAVLGGLIFACSLALQSQIPHAQTFVRFPIPIAFLFAFLFSKELKPRYFLGTLLAVVYQIYCGIYLGFLLLIPIAIFLTVILMSKRKVIKSLLFQKKWLISMLFYAISSFLLLLPLMLPYLDRSHQTIGNSYEQVFVTLPKISSYLFAPYDSFLWNSLSVFSDDFDLYWTQTLFTGIIATSSLLVMTFFILRKRNENRPVFNLYFITIVLTFLLFIRIGDFSLYELIYSIPGFSSMRSLARVINIELIFFGFAVAFVGNKMINYKPKWTNFIFILFVGLITIDNYFPPTSYYKTAKGTSQNRVNTLVEKMKSIPEGSVVSYEPAIITDVNQVQLDAMLAAQSLGLKSINGYSATSPYIFDQYWAKMDEESRKAWLKYKKMENLKVYVIH